MTEITARSAQIGSGHTGKLGTTRIIVAISIGNALEWFDLVVYGFLAATIAKLFFPFNSQVFSLLVTLATFGVAFLMRPLGSIVLGALADRAGRKKTLTLTIGLMLLGTLMTALTPTYAQIGILAPIILVTARLIQGFSAGGEFGSATALLSELNPRRRGYYASWQFASQGLVTILASAAGIFIASLTPEQLNSWGWRAPFLFGLLIGPVAIWMRRQLPESEEFQESKESGETGSLGATVVGQRVQLLLSLGVVIALTVGVYTLLYLPTYAVRSLGLHSSNAFTGTLLMGLIQLVLIPLFGALSDRIDRSKIMIIATFLVVVSIIPAFDYLTSHRSAFVYYLVLIWLAVLLSAYAGPLSALMSELFPTRSRGAGLAISYSFAVTIFGGFAPFIIAWLISVTGSSLAPAFYLVFGGVLSLIALFYIRRTVLK